MSVHVLEAGLAAAGGAGHRYRGKTPTVCHSPGWECVFQLRLTRGLARRPTDVMTTPPLEHCCGASAPPCQPTAPAVLAHAVSSSRSLAGSRPMGP